MAQFLMGVAGLSMYHSSIRDKPWYQDRDENELKNSILINLGTDDDPIIYKWKVPFEILKVMNYIAYYAAGLVAWAKSTPQTWQDFVAQEPKNRDLIVDLIEQGESGDALGQEDLNVPSPGMSPQEVFDSGIADLQGYASHFLEPYRSAPPVRLLGAFKGHDVFFGTSLINPAYNPADNYSPNTPPAYISLARKLENGVPMSPKQLDTLLSMFHGRWIRRALGEAAVNPPRVGDLDDSTWKRWASIAVVDGVVAREFSFRPADLSRVWTVLEPYENNMKKERGRKKRAENDLRIAGIKPNATLTREQMEQVYTSPEGLRYLEAWDENEQNGTHLIMETTRGSRQRGTDALDLMTVIGNGTFTDSHGLSDEEIEENRIKDMRLLSLIAVNEARNTIYTIQAIEQGSITREEVTTAERPPVSSKPETRQRPEAPQVKPRQVPLPDRPRGTLR